MVADVCVSPSYVPCAYCLSSHICLVGSASIFGSLRVRGGVTNSKSVSDGAMQAMLETWGSIMRLAAECTSKGGAPPVLTASVATALVAGPLRAVVGRPAKGHTQPGIVNAALLGQVCLRSSTGPIPKMQGLTFIWLHKHAALSY